jgi:hypothetical protein
LAIEEAKTGLSLFLEKDFTVHHLAASTAALFAFAGRRQHQVNCWFIGAYSPYLADGKRQLKMAAARYPFRRAAVRWRPGGIIITEAGTAHSWFDLHDCLIPHGA